MEDDLTERTRQLRASCDALLQTAMENSRRWAREDERWERLRKALSAAFDSWRREENTHEETQTRTGAREAKTHAEDERWERLRKALSAAFDSWRREENTREETQTRTGQ